MQCQQNAIPGSWLCPLAGDHLGDGARVSLGGYRDGAQHMRGQLSAGRLRNHRDRKDREFRGRGRGEAARIVLMAVSPCLLSASFAPFLHPVSELEAREAIFKVQIFDEPCTAPYSQPV